MANDITDLIEFLTVVCYLLTVFHWDSLVVHWCASTVGKSIARCRLIIVPTLTFQAPTTQNTHLSFITCSFPRPHLVILNRRNWSFGGHHQWFHKCLFWCALQTPQNILSVPVIISETVQMITFSMHMRRKECEHANSQIGYEKLSFG